MIPSNNKVALLGSGGLDTMCSMILLKEAGYDIQPIYFDYDQKTASKEIPAVRRYAKEIIGKDVIVFKMQDYQTILGNIWALTGNVSETIEDKESIFIPGRNIIFLLFAAIDGYFKDTYKMAISLHKNDTISGDCKPPFVESFARTLTLGMSTPKRPVEYEILMPLKDLYKYQAIKAASMAGYDLSISWSCDDSKEHHCGICRQCIERKNMFELAGVQDNTIYLQ